MSDSPNGDEPEQLGSISSTESATDEWYGRPDDAVSVFNIAMWLAHGTSDYQKARVLYLTDAEREAAFKDAVDCTFEEIRQGSIPVTGLWGNTPTGKRYPEDRWARQRYSRHQTLRLRIEPARITQAVLTVSSSGDIIRVPGGEWISVFAIKDEIDRQLVKALIEKIEETDKYFGSASNISPYSTPYLDLMRRAIGHFKIAKDNQPLKDNLLVWFQQEWRGPGRLSDHLAGSMATLVRLPDAQRGGNRPWRAK